MLTALGLAALALALLFAGMAAINLVLFRPPPAPAAKRPAVSLLIPARDEAEAIGATLDAALASEGVTLEVLVLDDGSTDATAEVVRARMAVEPRLRLIDGPPLPKGWIGKQHACHVLAGEAAHETLVFLDADVVLAPDALARFAQALAGGLDLASGFPREETRTLAETLVVPLIHVLLIGYLPLGAARRRPDAGFAAGCGQLMAVRRTSYARAGGHAAIRLMRHDGLMLPRAFRRAGCATDLFDATGLARCRMYAGAAQVWHGFSKNATEAMARPLALPVWTLLLGGGHVMPFVLAPVALAAQAPVAAGASFAACACVWGARAAMAIRFRQRWTGVLLHPVGVLAVLALNWSALAAQMRGRPAVWRGRAYLG